MVRAAGSTRSSRNWWRVFPGLETLSFECENPLGFTRAGSAIPLALVVLARAYDKEVPSSREMRTISVSLGLWSQREKVTTRSSNC
jgi:hypothetical protein